MKRIDELREAIDRVDDQLVMSLAERRKLIHKILEEKAGDKSLRSIRREQELLARLITEGKKAGLDAHFVTRVFHEVIDDSLRAQELELLQEPNGPANASIRVAYQGIEGAYSQLAAQKFFSKELDRTELVGYPVFDDAVQAVKEKKVNYAVLPIENTTAGSINQVYDLLSRVSLAIVGEEVLRVDHCLLGLKEVPLLTIRRVLSHPQALSQCSRFLARLENCQSESFSDTAAAVRKVKEDQNLSQAAIASEDAGRKHGLKVLERNLADQRENYTRFLVIAQDPIQVDQRIPCKTSLVMATSHEEGALLRALNSLHLHKLNMTKLESRPRAGMPFQYLFYVDFEGNLIDGNVQQAMEELRGETMFLRILGSYPMQARPRTAPPPASYVTAARQSKTPSDRPAAAIASYKLASRGSRSRDTTIDVRGVSIGGPDFVVIAGPCAVESREQILSCARQVREVGAHILRGGCFKPRTSPYSFQGLGYEGLELLVEAGQEYDLPIITEVLSPSDIKAVAEVSDILQIGARNMQNFALLKAAGQSSRPVMLKRGMMAKIDEFLHAAEYILAQGNQQVILCERGIRTFETSTRNTLDLGAIPILKRLTHLPIVVDPSHAAGQRELVTPLALAAHAVGPHGMMVEIHPKPENALSDGPQALEFPDFIELMETIYGS